MWPKRNKKTRGAMPRSPMLRDQSLRTLARKKYLFTFHLVPKKSRIEAHLPPPWLQTLLSTRLKESISSGSRLCFLFRALAPQFLSRFFLTDFVRAQVLSSWNLIPCEFCIAQTKNAYKYRHSEVKTAHINFLCSCAVFAIGATLVVAVRSARSCGDIYVFC